MEKIKVLQFGMGPNPGGVESFIINYYRHIDKNKFQIDFINMYDEIAYENEIKALGGNIYRIPFFKTNPIKNYGAIDKILKENKYDIIHVNMLSLAYLTPLIIGKKNGVKCRIAHSHNGLTPPGIVRNLLHKVNKKRIHLYANTYFACSKLAGAWMFGESNIKKNDISIINNAVDITAYKFDLNKRREMREQLGLEGKLVIGHVGRFSYQKNHDFLIEIFYEIQKINKNSCLVLVGTGELLDEVKNKVSKLGIEDKVKFLGVRKDVNEIMQAMDKFIMPSRFEGLPLVGIEAQASGLSCYFSSNITKELLVTSNATIISAEKEANYWAKMILQEKSVKDRTQTIQELIFRGYEIKKETKALEKHYVDMLEKGDIL